MCMSEVDPIQQHYHWQRGAGPGHNRPTMATGMVEENSSLYDGQPEFELIGSDFFPSQKAGAQG